MCKLKGGSIETHMRRIGQATAPVRSTTKGSKSDDFVTKLNIAKELLDNMRRAADDDFVRNHIIPTYRLKQGYQGG